MNLKPILTSMLLLALAGCASVATTGPGQLTGVQAKAVAYCTGAKTAPTTAPDMAEMSLEQKQAYSICLKQSLPIGDYNSVTGSRAK